MVIASPRAAARGYQAIPPLQDMEVVEAFRFAANALRNLLRGKMNCTGTVTLTASSATTTLTDSRIGPESVIDPMPLTANAAAAKPSIYVTARTDGSCTLNHANDANVDKTFDYTVIG